MANMNEIRNYIESEYFVCDNEGFNANDLSVTGNEVTFTTPFYYGKWTITAPLATFEKAEPRRATPLVCQPEAQEVIADIAHHLEEYLYLDGTGFTFKSGCAVDGGYTLILSSDGGDWTFTVPNNPF